MGRWITIAAVIGLLALPSASSAASPGLVEVRAANGSLLASGGSGFSFPGNGSLVRVGKVSISLLPGFVELRDVSLLGGEVQVRQIRLPFAGLAGASVVGLDIGGRARRVVANTLAPVGRKGYLIALQEAIVPMGDGTRTGLVGLRLTLSRDAGGAAAGSEVLVGLQGAVTAKIAREGRATRDYRRLGFGGPVVPGQGLPSIADPQPIVAVPSGGSPVGPVRTDQPATLGEQAVAIALRYLGVPYVWAAADPGVGFDCSGLTMYVYRQLGIQLTHFAGAQFHEGTPVPSDQPQPGDLVFFEPGNLGPGHVGIYLGSGKFIEAPHTGAVVQIASFADPKWSGSYVGAVRPY